MPNATKPDSAITKGAAVAGLAVLGSRILGLLREQIFAYFFGASREYDAFLTAFRIPNLLRDLLAEGALSAAFVTIFVRELSQHGKQRAYEVANSVFNALALLLMGVTALGIVCAPSLVHAIALGFDPQKSMLAASLTQLMFPFIVFVALAAVCMGMLNAQGRYGLPQSASTFFNFVSIVVGLGSAWLLAPDYMATLWQRGDQAPAMVGAPPLLWQGLLPYSFWPPHLALAPARAMVGMTVGTLAGGLVQWLVQVPSLWRLGWRYRPNVALHDPALRDVLRLMAPAVMGAAAVQISVFINSNFASTLGDRPISWLSYSFRLMQLPIGLFGVAVMTASLPAMSRHAAAQDDIKFADTLMQSLALVLCLTVPAAVGLMLLGEPIVRLLFEHGRFTPADTQACAHALAAYALGLPCYSALKIVQPAFVARGDARTPMLVSLGGVLASAALNYAFLYGLELGHVGLALSTSVMATLSVLMLLQVLGSREPHCRWHDFFGQTGRIALAAVVMAVTLVAGRGLWDMAQLPSGLSGAVAEVATLLPLGGACYVVAGRLLGVHALEAALVLVQKKMRRRE